MKTLVKICGIRSLEAAQISVEAGADFLGFNFIPSSKRYISPTDAKAIIQKLPKTISIVGVFQNESIGRVNQIISNLNLQFVQLHGEENQDYIDHIKNAMVIKTMNLEGNFTAYSCSYFLLDRPVQGSGLVLDLQKVKTLTKQFSILLAGGLTVETVVDAITVAEPLGVDVASGIETDGREDVQKIRQFVQEVKGI